MARVPASIRYKNPGAMWGSALAIKWGAAKKAVALADGTGQNNNIAVFKTYEDGICAQLDLWRTSKHYRNKPFKDAIRVWSGGNHVESYIAFVLKRVPGMTRNTVMNDAFWASPMGIAFLKAQAWHEAGRQYPAPDADWIKAQQRVFGGVIPKPAPRKPRKKPPTETDTKPAAQSGIIQKALVAIMAAIGTAVESIMGALGDWRVLSIIASFVVVGLLVWIIWERAGKPDIRGLFSK
jgi:hypothetical protein